MTWSALLVTNESNAGIYLSASVSYNNNKQKHISQHEKFHLDYLYVLYNPEKPNGVRQDYLQTQSGRF